MPDSARRNPGERAAFITDAIRELMRSHPFKGKQCVLSLPAETTFVQHLKMAKMPEEQMSQALQWELQGKLPYDPSRAIIRHIVAGEIFSDDEVKQEVVVLAASRDVVQSHIDLAKRAKLDVVGINVEPCAIVECFGRLFRRTEDVNHATLFLDIGACSTQVVICHGSQLAFAKNLFIGSTQFDQAVAEGMRLPLQEARQLRYDLQADNTRAAGDSDGVYRLLDGSIAALAAEVTNCLRYHESVFPNRPVERMIFLGGQAHDKRLCQGLAQQLTLPAQIGDPLARIKRSDGAGLDIGLDRRTIQPDWAVAVGLSLGAGMANEHANHAA
jgi:type IV pilus assembly protein PilM